MEEPCLKDKNEYPADEVLGRYLGDVKGIWDSFIQILKDDPLIITEWRYYKDGKSWLFKVTKKKKTICWVSVCQNLFKTTFYFPDKAEDFLKSSKLKNEYIDQFINGKKYGKIRGVTVEVKSLSDLEMTGILIDIKAKIK